MPVRIMTMVWGTTHLDLFNRGALRSLAWPRNRDAIREWCSGWDIYSCEDDFPAIRGILAAFDLPLNFVDLGGIGALSWTLQDCIVKEMQLCVERGEAFLMAPPDTIFGDGSVQTLCQLGQRHGVVVSVPHVRCLPSVLGELQDVLNNEDLVHFAWNHLHPTWSQADVKGAQINSFLGGVAWERIEGTKLIMVTHRLPTPYLVNPQQDDIDWYLDQPMVGVYDHAWPMKLVDEQRQRVIGSSDAAFMVEVTDAEKNVPPVQAFNPGEPDIYYVNNLHNAVNRNLVAIFREA